MSKRRRNNGHHKIPRRRPDARPAPTRIPSDGIAVARPDDGLGLAMIAGFGVFFVAIIVCAVLR